MSWDIIEGKWKQFKGKAREEWGELTDDELDQAEATVNNSKACCKKSTARPKPRRKRPWTVLRPACRVCNRVWCDT